MRWFPSNERLVSRGTFSVPEQLLGDVETIAFTKEIDLPRKMKVDLRRA
jgi:hypothetical protein